MKRPSIKSPCVADRYAAPFERIAEFLTPSGQGGLISVRETADGNATVDVYNLTKMVTVTTSTEKKSPTFTSLEMEAALCVWEEILTYRMQAWERDPENKNFKPDLPPLSAWHKALDDAYEGVGSSAMRFVSIAAGKIVLAVHDHMTDLGYELVGAYDWEFVPAVVAVLDWPTLVASDQYSHGVYAPDPAALFEAIKPVLADNLHHTDPLESYLKTCRTHAASQWGYKELIDDHIETFQQGFVQKIPAAEIVKTMGEKYDLTPKSEWERGY